MNSSKSRASPETITQIPLADLHPFPDHPFSVRDDDSMKDTVASVKEHGILVPIIVRPREEGGYEIIEAFVQEYSLSVLMILIRFVKRIWKK